MSLFSYLLLKMKLYRYHFLSIIIITIVSIIHIFVYYDLSIDVLKENYKGYIIYFFTGKPLIYYMFYINFL